MLGITEKAIVHTWSIVVLDTEKQKESMNTLTD
jgi:hypothetical protein